MSQPVVTLLQCQERVIPKVQECIDRVAQKYNRQMPMPTIEWFGIMKGRASGKAIYRNGQLIFQINQKVMAENLDAYVENDVPHEVAHLAVWFIHGVSKTIKPHGKEWKEMMALFGAAALRTHNYDMGGLRQTYLYKCACPNREFQLTARRHNQFCLGKKKYKCKECDQILTRVFPSV